MFAIRESAATCLCRGEPYDSAPVAAESPASRPAAPAASGRRIAVNTAIFSIATGFSRIAGLVREIVASSYFATSGAFSAFTIAFQVPNLVRSLFADAALSAAFVPVFTELLEKGQRREAFRLASTLFFLILLVLGGLTAFFILAAGAIVPLLTGPEFTPELDQLTVGLSKVLFPIVLVLGLNGLVVGILNAYDHFTIPALSPLVWNVVIIALLIGLRPTFEGDDELYAYAVAVLVATIVQFLMCVPVLRRFDFRFELAFNPRDPRVKRVLVLMLPVTIGLGVINLDVFINLTLGSLVSEQAPRAIDAAFRIYMLPQGVFSVALATVLFPALSRLAARGDTDGLRATMSSGVRQIALLLLPAAAFTLVLAEPIVRLVYEHGEFGPESTHLVSTALFWFSFSLPFSGMNLMLTRTYFALQKPWAPTAISLGSLVVNLAVSLALYKPYGIAGLVIGTAVSSIAMMLGQAYYLRGHLGGSVEGRRTAIGFAAVTVAAALLGIVAWTTWSLFDAVLGRSLVAQVIAMVAAGAAGGAAYAASVLWMGMPEARQVRDLLVRRLGR
jgi:putative peptidoglycan lipid II flippase